MVRRLAPDARVDIGHGQMREGDLERVMTRFIRGETDVLVCTTIIGSGIDIPNANTIIINAADNFGLSELYQLRGRVGRYKHRAFAYLLVPADKALSEDAQKRLQALEDFSNLGAGFRIAMRDLEIRGCGNILGGEQHGHIAAVGLDTYTQLLQETVAELRGEPVERRMLPQFEVSIDAHIPDAYVPSEAQRMTLYRRIATVSSVEDADEMRAEVADRFGPPPVPVKRLLDIMRVRALAADHGVTRLVAAGSALALEFASARYLGQGTRTRLSQHFGARVQFSFGDTPTITFTHDGGDADSAVRSAQHLLNALRDEEDGDI
jgi:transcription-repair coupling factor (superfamily II helicase)